MSVNFESVKRTTIDEKEVHFFKKLSANWWDINGETQTIHSSTNLLISYIRDEIICKQAESEYVNTDRPLHGVDVLEVGCGGGIMSEKLAQMGCNLTAIDITSDLIQVAKHHASSDTISSKINYKLESVEDHVVKNYEKYDVLVSNFVLEHVSDHDYFIESCTKCLKPGGSIFMSAVSKTFLSWLGVIYLAENIIKCMPVGMHDYEKCIKAEETHKLLRKHNCEAVSTKGLCYNFFTKQCFWVPTWSLSYIVHAVKSE